MFRISVCFRKARGKEGGRTPGVVFYRIGERPDGERSGRSRSVTSDIRGFDESVIQSEKERIVFQIRLFYCLIEEKNGSEFTLDDVTYDFKAALSGDITYAKAVAKARTDFPLRGDLVSVGNNFKDDFRYILGPNCAKDSLLEYIFSFAQVFKIEKRDSLARHYLSVLSNLRIFTDDSDIRFGEISADFIRRYSDRLRQTGISQSTESFYLRTLRAILNKAHADGLIADPSGWFCEVNTQIQFNPKETRKPLDSTLLLRIESLNLSGNDFSELVRDMFMFAFYCGGMELVDVANLKFSDIHNGLLVYSRRLKGRVRKVALGQSALRIISRYGNDADTYLFPLLAISDNALFSTIRSYVSRSMKRIGRAIDYPDLSFSMNISAYRAMLAKASVPEMLLQG